MGCNRHREQGISAHLLEPGSDRAVAEAERRGDLPEAGTLGLHLENALTIRYPAWATKLLTVGTGINEPTLHPFLRQ